MTIESFVKMRETYHRTLDQAVWFERLMQRHALNLVVSRPVNTHTSFSLDLAEHGHGLKYALCVNLFENEQQVSFSLLSGIDPAEKRRYMLAALFLVARYDSPDIYSAALNGPHESRMRDLLELREREMGHVPICDVGSTRLRISDGTRFHVLAERMMQLRGSVHELELAALRGKQPPIHS